MKHPNIPMFAGFTDSPHYSLMMEYAQFDFKPFGIEKTVSNLGAFYHFVDYGNGIRIVFRRFSYLYEGHGKCA